jgi:hypothetical protein
VVLIFFQFIKNGAGDPTINGKITEVHSEEEKPYPFVWGLGWLASPS